MRHKLLNITIIFLAILIGVTVLLAYIQNSKDTEDTAANQQIALNEIWQLTRNAVENQDSSQLTKIEEKTTELQESMRSQRPAVSGTAADTIWLIGGLGALFLLFVSGYFYTAVIRPFEKMKKYAEQIASGDFELALDYERSNYFGEFTWSFDQMRREIKKSRACEKEAIENNKTVIATLSHDIKTPIASIRAYTEGLEANLDSDPEKRAQFLKVIMKKCDEVAKYTNDLFLHSLADLDKLRINPEKLDICKLLAETIREIEAGGETIRIILPGRPVYIQGDANRFAQVIENLINNARKYAKTKIDIVAETKGDVIEIRIRDFGPGIPDEDMPFIFDKFYRGRNCGNEQGSGLGLYIVRYLVEQMKGEIRLYNREKGVEAVIKVLKI